MINTVISMGGERLNNFLKQCHNQNIVVQTIKGVSVNKGDIVLKEKVNHSGNAGCFLAHLNAIKFTAGAKEHVNIFEDDELLHDNYIPKRNLLLKNINNFHYVNLTTKRPHGISINDYFLKIVKDQKTSLYFNNVRGSNYILSPSFAKVWLDYLNSNNGSKWINKLFGEISGYDHFKSHITSSYSDKYRGYILKQKYEISTHSRLTNTKGEVFPSIRKNRR